MVTNSFGNKTFMQPMRRLSMHSKCLDFFSLKFWVGVGKVGRIFLIFPLFLTCSHKFPMGSQYVPYVFPKGVLNSTSLNPICFAQKSPPLLTYI
jgi:hypothetical protein